MRNQEMLLPKSNRILRYFQKTQEVMEKVLKEPFPELRFELLVS